MNWTLVLGVFCNVKLFFWREYIVELDKMPGKWLTNAIQTPLKRTIRETRMYFKQLYWPNVSWYDIHIFTGSWKNWFVIRSLQLKSAEVLKDACTTPPFLRNGGGSSWEILITRLKCWIFSLQRYRKIPNISPLLTNTDLLPNVAPSEYKCPVPKSS